MIYRPEYDLVRVESESQSLSEKIPNLRDQSLEILTRMMEKQHIIDIPPIVTYPQGLLDPPIELMEIEIAK